MKKKSSSNAVNACFAIEFAVIVAIYIAIKAYIGLAAAELFMATVLAFALHDCVIYASEKLDEENNAHGEDDVEEKTHEDANSEEDGKEDN